VEVHDPVRLLFVIEATPEDMLGIMDRQPPIAQMIRNGWVQLATLSPSGPEIHVFNGKSFAPYKPEHDSLPQVATSHDWYAGKREHLGFALLPRLVWGTPKEAVA
jgi:hypothetical protein